MAVRAVLRGKRQRARRSLVGAVLGAVSLASPVARADGATKDVCISANESLQVSQRAGQFREARQQIAVCMSEACPAVLRSDCADRLAEIDRLQPTIVFDARDLEGHDVARVTVTLDGQPFATTLDGQALPVDPGEHTFTFQLADNVPVTKTYVLKVGQKERREPVVVVGQSTAVQPSGAAEESPATAGGSESAAPSAPGRGQRFVGIGVGAAGVLGLGIGAVLGVVAVSKWSSATSACPRPGPCADYKEGQADRADALGAATGSTVAFVAGGVLLAGGAAIYFTAPKAAPASALRLAPEVGPGVARMTLRGTF